MGGSVEMGGDEWVSMKRVDVMRLMKGDEDMNSEKVKPCRRQKRKYPREKETRNDGGKESRWKKRGKVACTVVKVLLMCRSCPSALVRASTPAKYQQVLG